MTKHAEDLAKLGWQYLECPACGSEGARAFPKPEPNKDVSPCPEFWDWLPKAYNFVGDGNFTKYNMEVAFLAGKQSVSTQEPVAWRPDVCPITGLPFFMWIEHHETGQMVPTYGGPYDSYTIPARDKDGSYCRERYDHDRGGWLTDEVEDVGVQIVSDQAYVSDEPPASKPLTDEQIRAVIAKIDPNEHYLPNSLRQLARAIEAAHGIGEKK